MSIDLNVQIFVIKVDLTHAAQSLSIWLNYIFLLIYFLLRPKN